MYPSYEFLKTLFNVSDETFLVLQKISKFKKIDKNTAVAKVGEIPSKVYLLTSGIMRVYLNSENGKEYNKNIFSPMSFVGSLTSIVRNTPSILTYETLTDCKVIEIDFRKIQKLCRSNLEVSNFYNSILEYVFALYEKRQLEFLTLNATQRYFKLRDRILFKYYSSSIE
ncbi:hypothetical protein A9Q87_12320 [Flavobacteriales bacterium 34_180_T64]|nr:hypothetical protein A9Q87_12320 [Flavobacteriales bacterium 34_180_T64]